MEIFGVRVDGVSFDKALWLIQNKLKEKRFPIKPYFIVTPNPEQVILALPWIAVMNKSAAGSKGYP